jgi:oligopeptide transport system substrate-binding protein
MPNLSGFTFSAAMLATFFSAPFLQGAESDVERANREGILLVGNNADPKAIDPQLVTGVVESKVIGALFEGLCGDHPQDDNGCTPGVAARWESNEDSTEWTFHLNPDAKWSDNVPITSEDFVFSYHRMLHPEFAAPYGEMLYFLDGAEEYNKDRRGRILFQRAGVDGIEWEKIKEVNFEGEGGLDKKSKAELEALAGDLGKFAWPESVPEATRKAIVIRMLETYGQDLWDLAKVGVEAAAPHVLKLRLRERTPYLPSVTRHYTWFPVPRHVVLKHGKLQDRFTDWTRPENIQGNGPFKLKKWAINHVLEVERNPAYWDVENVRLNGIRFFPTENPYTEARAFLAGQLHTTYVLPADQIPWVRKNRPEWLRVDPYLGVSFLRMNTTRKGLDDPRVRQAIAFAIDREAICQHILEGYKPADTITPPMQGYRADPFALYNPEKARALMAEAGYPGGAGFPTYSIMIGRITTRATAEALQSMLQTNLGIRVEIQGIEWSAFISAMQALNFDMGLSGWIGDYLDPSTFLYMWTEGNGNNNTGWHDKKFEALLKESANRPDPASRLAGYKEAESIFMKAMPVAPIGWHSRNYLHHPSAKGWYPLLLDNHPWKSMYLEPTP